MEGDSFLVTCQVIISPGIEQLLYTSIDPVIVLRIPCIDFKILSILQSCTDHITHDFRRLRYCLHDFSTALILSDLDSYECSATKLIGIEAVDKVLIRTSGSYSRKDSSSLIQ